MSKKETQETKEVKTYTRRDLWTVFFPWVIIVVTIFTLSGAVLGWDARSTADAYIQAQAKELSK